ncbi:MAG: hypothetical protein ACRD2A_22765, partial [Vicinamibacterales bacterium]
MKTSFGRFAVLGVLLAFAAPATAQIPSPQDVEVIVVESLNADTVKVPQLQIGAKAVFLVSPVKRPETICGNVGGSPSILVDCFEFAFVYVTYDTTGKQILHLPECNAVPYDDLTCLLPSNNSCAGNLTLDPFQIKAPVCGDTEVDIIPLNDTVLNPIAAAFGKWDGVSTNNRVFLYTDRNGAINANTRYVTETIRIPASVVNPTIPGATIALLAGRHEPLPGFG